MTAYITQADLEERYTPAQVRRVFTDDGSNTPGTSLATVLEQASRRADTVLLKAWGAAGVALLVANDAAVKGWICAMAWHYGASRRPEWVGQDGRSPTYAAFKDALEALEALAQAELRSAGESAAGENTKYADRVNHPQDPPFLFAPTMNRPTPGGY